MSHRDPSAGANDRVGWPRNGDRAAPHRPLSPLASLAVWAAVALLVWLEWRYPVVEGPTSEAFLGALIGAIAAVFGFIGQAAVTVAVTIAQAAVMIGIAIAHFAVQVGLVFAKVWGFLGKFWTVALKPFITWTWRSIERISGWLKRTFGPVIELLERIRREVDKFYNQFVKPVLDTIDATRRVLQILAQLRVPWARELDAKLSDLESRILRPIREIYSRLNDAMNWINRIVTLDGLIQRVTFIRSQIQYVADSWRVLINSRSKALTGSQRDELRRLQGGRTLADARRDLDDVMRAGGGSYSAGASEIVAMLEIEMRGS